jgi:hypothetical protein
MVRYVYFRKCGERRRIIMTGREANYETIIIFYFRNDRNLDYREENDKFCP